MPVAVNCWLAPATMLGVSGVTEIDISTGGEEVVELLLLPDPQPGSAASKADTADSRKIPRQRITASKRP